MMKTCVLLAILGLASAACPNACSGNGVCGANDKCSCYQNFQGADCSLRTCTFTLAWADTADGTNQAHYYAECGNKGVCDRKTGECKCFDGYEGKGCRRSTCPDSCSGHGTCEYIEELAGDYQDRRYGPGNRFQDQSCSDSRTSGPGNDGSDSCKITGSQVGGLTVAVTAAASGNLDLATLADASTEVTVAAALYNLIVNGDRVTYGKGAGTKATALTDNTDYFARKSTTANSISIHASAANAISGASALDLGTGATGTDHTLTYNPGSDLNTCGTGNDENCRLTVEIVGSDPGCDVTVQNSPADTTGATLGAGILGTISINDVTRCATLPGIMLTKSRGVTTTGAGTSSTLATRVNGGLKFTGWSTIDNTYFGSGGLTTSYITARNANTDVTHGHLYQLWDAGKIQGCKCDLGYDGPDCSHRVSPHGDDPLTTVKSSMMKQVVQVGHTDNSAFSTDARTREEFLMVYHDPYGGVWRTDGIVASTSDIIAASRVQDALRALPNEVLEGVSVKARTSSTVSLCTRFYDGVQHLGGYSETTDGAFKNSKMTTNFCETTYQLATATNKMDFTIEFADKPGQTGVQYLMEVDINKRGAGSFPVSGGITGGAYSVAEMNFNTNLGNLSELAECSDRGLDDGDGACECFDGFRGLACEEQEALV
jgi:hypothetical protein